MKLTDAQVDALNVLDENDGTVETSKKTRSGRGGWISGRCATALERLGLVTLKGWSPVVATLTPAGRTARTKP